jgi:predicted secreted protein
MMFFGTELRHAESEAAALSLASQNPPNIRGLPISRDQARPPFDQGLIRLQLVSDCADVLA